jgi:hypothetical protein
MIQILLHDQTTEAPSISECTIDGLEMNEARLKVLFRELCQANAEIQEFALKFPPWSKERQRIEKRYKALLRRWRSKDLRCL